MGARYTHRLKVMPHSWLSPFSESQRAELKSVARGHVMAVSVPKSGAYVVYRSTASELAVIREAIVKRCPFARVGVVMEDRGQVWW